MLRIHTIDGGATVWLRKPNPDGQEIPRYLERSGEELSRHWPQISSLTGSTGKQEQAPIPLRCHCRGIMLLVHRGNYTTMTNEKPPWFIDPRTKKHIANLDVCDSSRLHFGNDIVPWTFLDLANVTQGDGDAFPKTMAKLKAAVDAADPLIGTLAYYQSSSGVQRYFCKICSTSAFLASDDRPEAVGVPVGLLEASDGSRAESFLSWGFGDSPVGVDDTKGGWREGIIKRVLADAGKFRVARDYPRSWGKHLGEATAGSS